MFYWFRNVFVASSEIIVKVLHSSSFHELLQNTIMVVISIKFIIMLILMYLLKFKILLYF